ncbi:hypothetical protein HPP92_018473 [Vanilla planifolia]|uniref:HMA domain-containing protein n=1 Tax=Vanilla planifolia TaxID=51239 RepID=A0A835Q9W1_VANPL|nr:hypothetical protein HPP92_018473 [Vanilla planifolia]
MASLLFKDIKGVNLTCTSPASTAVCTSLERRSTIQPSIIGRAVDIYRRHPRRGRASNPVHQTSSKAKSCTQRSRKSSEKENISSTSPAGSSRYLLNGNSLGTIPESDAAKATTPAEKPNPQTAFIKEEEIQVLNTSSSAREDQVVTLRVSLHCKGCEGKVRKHISKMEGVTSFEIDMVKKKVTVVGNITPLGVLSSVSKVKSAQFWPSPPRASTSS